MIRSKSGPVFSGFLGYALVYLATKPTGFSMASADEQLKRLTDPSLLNKISSLRELNISEHIALPQVSSSAIEKVDTS